MSNPMDLSGNTLATLAWIVDGIRSVSEMNHYDISRAKTLVALGLVVRDRDFRFLATEAGVAYIADLNASVKGGRS